MSGQHTAASRARESQRGPRSIWPATYQRRMGLSRKLPRQCGRTAAKRLRIATPACFLLAQPELPGASTPPSATRKAHLPARW
jgi:hypothetical protein